MKIGKLNMKTRGGVFSEINKKYAEPKIQMTPVVKIILFFLRAYLLVLIGLLVYKFITLIK